MSKYWLLVRMGMQNMMIYRFNFFSWFLVEGIGILIMAYIWMSVYSEGGTVGTYSLRDMVVYYVVSRVVGMIVVTDDIAYRSSDDIMTGKILNNFLKPLNYLKSLFAINLGGITASLFLSLPVIVVLLLIFHNAIAFSTLRVLLFVLALVLAAIINFLIATLFGMLSFFMENIVGMIFFNWIMINLFSGRMLPLDILPSSIRLISDWLPFRFTAFSPLQIITSKLSLADSWHELLLAGIWVIILVIANKAMFKKGITRYEGYGI